MPSDRWKAPPPCAEDVQSLIAVANPAPYLRWGEALGEPHDQTLFPRPTGGPGYWTLRTNPLRHQKVQFGIRLEPGL